MLVVLQKAVQQEVFNLFWLELPLWMWWRQWIHYPLPRKMHILIEFLDTLKIVCGSLKKTHRPQFSNCFCRGIDFFFLKQYFVPICNYVHFLSRNLIGFIYFLTSGLINSQCTRDTESNVWLVLRGKDQENGIEQLHEREEQNSSETQVVVDLVRKDRELEEESLKFRIWVVEGLTWQLAYVNL